MVALTSPCSVRIRRRRASPSPDPRRAGRARVAFLDAGHGELVHGGLDLRVFASATPMLADTRVGILPGGRRERRQSFPAHHELQERGRSQLDLLAHTAGNAEPSTTRSGRRRFSIFRPPRRSPTPTLNFADSARPAGSGRGNGGGGDARGEVVSGFLEETQAHLSLSNGVLGPLQGGDGSGGITGDGPPVRPAAAPAPQIALRVQPA